MFVAFSLHSNVKNETTISLLSIYFNAASIVTFNAADTANESRIVLCERILSVQGLSFPLGMGTSQSDLCHKEGDEPGAISCFITVVSLLNGRL